MYAFVPDASIEGSDLATREQSIDVEGCLRDPMSPAEFFRLGASLRLLQYRDDLFFAESFALHGLLLMKQTLLLFGTNLGVQVGCITDLAPQSGDGFSSLVEYPITEPYRLL